MVGNLQRYFGWNAPSAGMYSSDRVCEVFPKQALQKVPRGSRLQRSQRLHVSVIGSQHHEPGVWELAANREYCVDPVHHGHLQVHQSNMGAMDAELFDRLL